ncbi:MAG: hypothetical protein ACTSVV_01670 [Promethearchaeota archaeon]
MVDEIHKKEFLKIGFCVYINDQSSWLTSGRVYRAKIDNEKELFISMENEGYITISIGYKKDKRDYLNYIQ